MRSSPLTVCAVISCLVPATARARGPMVETLEHGSWAVTIAQLQLDVHSEGDRIHVRVVDGNHVQSPCGTYALTLDPAGVCAFEIGSCDPSTNATELTLIDRSALFFHDEGISKPREIDIYATRIESVQDGGGAHVLADSDVACTADVRPFMPDLEHGTRVALLPGRYQLAVHHDDVRITHDATHWTIGRAAGGPSTIAYEIVDLRTGEIVLRGAVELDCARRHATPPLVVADAHQVVAIAALPTLHKPWRSAFSVGVTTGVAVMRPSGLTFRNDTGSVGAADLGLRDQAGGVLGVTVAYERPWFFAALGFNSALVDLGPRTLVELGGATTIGTRFRAGPCSFYVGGNLAVSSYQLTGVGSGLLAWQSDPQLGVGAATGLRVHLGERSMAVFGLDVTAPIVGAQPWLIVASLGGGFGR